MKPKRTDRTPHPSSEGRLIPDGPDISGALDRLAGCLGRALSDGEAESVRDLIALGLDLRRGDDRSPHADTRHTLQAMARMNADEQVTAMTNCDQDARDAIAAAQRDTGGLAEAIALASEQFAPGKRGARRRWYQLEVARRTHRLWQSLAEEPGRIWYREDKASPAARFAQIVLSLIEGREFDIFKTIDLMKEPERG